MFAIRRTLSAFVFFSVSISYSQNQFAKWHIGSNAGIDFLSNPPSSFIGSAVGAQEGCSSIADAAGATLFYTNGATIRNAANAVMANGSGLAGSSSSFQGVVISRLPGSNNLYYVFTMAAISNTLTAGLCYSIVDMNLAAGMGSVTVKNATLLPNILSSECVAAARHCNGTDVWIIARPYKSLVFYSFLLTSNGISTVPVTSTLSSDSINVLGALKVSPSGKKIAFNGKNSTVVVCDFDNSTGTVGSNNIVLPFPSTYYFIDCFGIEFSPNSSKLYVSSAFVTNPSITNPPRKICQYDLCAGSTQAIINSRYLVHYDSSAFTGGALQLAKDGKIYKARISRDSIGVINYPNMSGAACGYSNTGQALGGQFCSMGLPNFVSGYMRTQQPQFTFTANCQHVNFTGFPGQSTLQACAAADYPITSSYWNFGDPASLQQNQSTQLNAFHYFTSPGTYTVQLIINRQCRADTFVQTLVVPDYSPTFTLTGKTNICAKESSTLSANGNYTYLWSNSTSASSTIVSPTTTTNYSVTATNTAGCSLTKTVTVVVSKCTDIADERISQSVQLFPNPNEGQFNVLLENSGELKLYEVSGRCVLQQTLVPGENHIDISANSKGIYYAVVIAENTYYYYKVITH